MSDMEVITPDRAFHHMRAIRANVNGDPEVAHSMADDWMCQILRSLGYGDTVEQFDQITKWYA